MRRGEKEIKDRAEIEAVIRASKVCRLGLADGSTPYVVPVFFGYDGQDLYLHGAKEGRKMDILLRNPEVCVEFDFLDGIKEGDKACGWGAAYRSVIVSGTAEVITEPAAKEKALAVIMAQYSGRKPAFAPAEVERVAVIRVRIGKMTGKMS
jgi:nitroimidazol reductase NimA-like FMN-containing flavoprotein (pyridoxamine 5'-phosphate oxidase superfamily)